MKTINNLGETLTSTISETNFIQKKNNNLLCFKSFQIKYYQKN